MFETAPLGKSLTELHKEVFTAPELRRISFVAGLTHSDSEFKAPEANIEKTEAVAGLDLFESTNLSKGAIRQQLARIVQSPQFVQSGRMSRFLRFIVEHALDGSRGCLKEHLIGSEVYDRRPPYHPSQDSIVRTEARRLRGKLKEYYDCDGKDDPIYVYLRLGSYLPAFQSKERLTGSQPELTSRVLGSPLDAETISTAILPFRDRSGSSLSSIYALGIPDELAYTLMRIKRCKVIFPAVTEHFNVREQGVTTAMSKVGAQIAFEGSVKEECGHIRVTARIVDAAGFQLWTHRFDAEADVPSLFVLQEQIASALSAGFDALFGDSPDSLEN
jgi:TolB-like protein